MREEQRGGLASTSPSHLAELLADLKARSVSPQQPTRPSLELPHPPPVLFDSRGDEVDLWLLTAVQGTQ